MSIILECVKEKNEEAKRNFPRGQRVVVSTSEVHGEEVVTYKRYARLIADFFPTIYVRLDNGRKIAVPMIGVCPVEEGC